MARSKNNEMSKSGLKRGQATGHGTSDVYNEMLRDALSSSALPGTVEGRPVKRRKTAGGVAAVSGDSAHGLPASTSVAEDDLLSGDSARNTASRRQQTAYNHSDVSEDSDFDWEDVDLAHTTTQQVSFPKNDDKLSLVLGGNPDTTSPGKLPRRRKPATAEERNMRRGIHKMHVLCLIAHVHLRNHWCNDEAVHKSLRSLLSKKNVSYLNPDESQSQFQRTRSFLDGLSQAAEAFKLHFKIIARGMSRSYWADNADELTSVNTPNGLDLPIEKSDFQDLAQQREASRDVGAQIFCALLRSVGVDARLVCSLQPLPFSGAAKGKPPEPVKPLVYTAAAALKDEVTESDSESGRGNAAANLKQSSPIGSLGGRNRFASAPSRLLEQQLPRNADKRPCSRLAEYTPMRPKRIVESSYPVYWVEAFDEAAQKWISVDPLVTKTIGKPAKLEPPNGDQENNMSYVIAFEDDGSARDVTRRYVKAYNAKTRKARLESIPHGAKWLRKVLRLYKRPHRLDRDQVEDTELTGKEAQEPLPDNVQDFKDHPYYALERHLKRNEVIHPKRETGKVMNGRAANAKGSEPIYRRRDVHIVRSADSWYRMGREIKPGEQPLKRVAARRKQQQAASYEESDAADDEGTDTALYAVHQTIEYQPPPVVNGRVPRNVYGNLDVYVPSMIPAGGAQIVHPECARAARLLGVDYAEAVTGFAFKGRHGTAIVDGAVVAAEFVTAIQEVITGFANESAQEEEARRSLEALRMWRRLLAGLRIRERIEGYNVEGDAYVPQAAQTDLEDDTTDGEAGGFFPTGDVEAIVASTAAPYQNDNTAGGEFVANSNAATQRTDHVPPETDSIASPRGYQPRNYCTEGHEQGPAEAMQEIPWAMPSIKIIYGRRIYSSHKDTVKRSQEGGGFMVDDDDDDHNLEVTRRSLSPVTKKPSTLFSLADEDLAQARTLQESYERQSRALESQPTTQGLKSTEMGSPKRLTLESSTSKEPTLTPLDIGEDQAPDEEILLPNKDGTSLKKEGSEDDAGSLLSEDPDDEDADPDWLV